MTIPQSSGTRARDPRLASLTSLITSVSTELSGLMQQVEMSDISQPTALAAIINRLSAVLDLMREMQVDLTAQGDDLVTTLKTLERAHQRYYDLFDLAPDAYLVTDADSRILEANQAAIRLIGYSRTYAYGRSLLSFVAPDSAVAVAAYLRALDETAADFPTEWDMRIRGRGRGPQRTVRARVRRTTDRVGSHRAFLWLLRRAHQEAQPDPATFVEPAIHDGTMARTSRRFDISEPLRTPQDATEEPHVHAMLERSDQRRPVAIVELVRQLIAVQRSRPVQVRTRGAIPTVQAHPEDLSQALSLILHYVDRSATPNIPVLVRVTATNAAVAVVVTSSGNTGSPPDRELGSISPNWVFEQARLIIEAQGGALEYATNDVGCVVTITLPVGIEQCRGQPRPPEHDARGVSPRVSRREYEVLGLLEQGLTNRQISERLFLSERTVEHHISRMLARFRLSTRTHLTAYALKHNLTGVSSGDGG